MQTNTKKDELWLWLTISYSWAGNYPGLELGFDFPANVEQLDYFIDQLDCNAENYNELVEKFKEDTGPWLLEVVALESLPQHALEDINTAIQATAKKFNWPSFA